MKKLGTMGNTLLFIGSVLFVILFQIIFGVQNGLIGVSIVMASLTMLRRDLTVAPFKNGLKLVLLNVIIGIASILAIENFWLAVILSFLVFFFLGYYMLYSLSKPLYIPFALEYLYLFLTPIQNRMIPLRIISLALGGIIIMGVNYIYYSKGNVKDEDKLLIGICNTLINKCKLIISGESPAKLDAILEKSFLNIRKVIYDKKEDRFSLTDEAAVKLAVISSVEKLNNLIPQLHNDEDERCILKEISMFLSTIENGIKTRKLFELEDALYKIKLRTNEKSKHSDASLSVINLLGFIQQSMTEVITLADDSKKISNKLSDNNTKLTLENKKLPILSFKFYFALRIACGMAIAILLSGFFIFSEGIWVIVTTFAIMLPLYGTSQKGIRYEVLGTLIGAIISYVLFTIFRGFGVGVLVILAASYFYAIFDKEYQYSGVLISISAFGIGYMVYGSSNIFTSSNIFLIVAGAVIAMIFESLLLPYNFNKAKSDLTKIYSNTLTEFLQETHNLAIGEKHSNIMNSLLMFAGLLEERMFFNNENLHSDADIKFVKDQRILFLSIYELYLWLDNNDLSPKAKSTINKFINMLINGEFIPKDEIKKVKENTDFAKSLEDKVALNTLNEISNLIADLQP